VDAAAAIVVPIRAWVVVDAMARSPRRAMCCNGRLTKSDVVRAWMIRVCLLPTSFYVSSAM